jgi:hypothetical protein
VDTTNSLYPWVSKDQLWREAEREAHRAWVAKQMKPANDLMARINEIRDEMAAITNVNGTDIRTVECWYPVGDEWVGEQRMALE